MSSLRVSESLGVVPGYAVAFLASVFALVLLCLGSVAGVPLADAGLYGFGYAFTEALAYAGVVVFVLCITKLPGTLPTLLRTIDPATASDEEPSPSALLVLELPTLALTYVGLAGLAFFILPLYPGACPAKYGVGCSISAGLRTQTLFGLSETVFVILFVLAHPLWALLWVLD